MCLCLLGAGFKTKGGAELARRQDGPRSSGKETKF